MPASALGVAQIHNHNEGLADYDARAGAVAPTGAQRAAVKRLHAKVTWNQFGTPASLSKPGKFLAKGVRGKTAAQAAHRWLYRNRVLFGLRGVDKLLLVGDTRMAFSRGHAVNFRQVIDGVATAEGGLVTVGLTGSANRGWNIAHVSSALTRDSSLAGRAKLSAAQAWVRAANLVGESYSVVDVRDKKVARGWTNLAVAGMADLQSVKLVAFPTVRGGVAPAFESIVLKAKDAVAFRVIVDARNGRLLARANLVENAASSKQSQLIETFTFSGSVPPTDAACGPMHGPYAVGSGVRALDVFAAATITSNDIVLDLYKDGVLVASADTLFSPEAIHYEPAGGVPPGSYTVQVCDFPDGAAWTAPTTYDGTFTIDDSPAPDPALARWKVFPRNPPEHVIPMDPWGNPSTDTREVWCWIDAPGCDDTAAGPLATSRGPWDHSHKLNAPTFTTIGNNANSATSWTNPFLPSPPGYRPTSAARNYDFEWSNDWFNTDCFPTPGAPGSTWDDQAATVNLFVMHNRIHDWSYLLGFTERNWNAQDYNFGLTEKFRENDPIIGDVQAGVLVGQRDNANMITLPDGFASVTNMYMWQPLQGSFYAPCVDGDYDMPIIAHEYGHMIENRMIGKGNSRAGHHAGAMGESFGDMNAMEYLNEYNFLSPPPSDRYATGAYATGNWLRAIRNYSMGSPMSGAEPRPSKQLIVNALNFSDMGYDVTGPQVHADGEIWSATNFRIRTLLNDKYDDDFDSEDEDLQADCADGVLPPTHCPGNRRWFQLYYDAMLLMPTAPSMLQARDAILAADMARFGGANQREIWLGFARSGYGEGAVSSNTTANTDTDPTPSFKSPQHDNAEITFRARDKSTGALLTNARIYVGHYEARVSPIADTDPATTGLNLDDVAEFAPGTYELVARAPGYGLLRGRKTFFRGEDSVIEFRFATNYASSAKGATATGDGTTPGNLLDDTEGTQWTAEGTITGGNLSVDGKKVTIDLAGTEPVRVTRLQVSAHLAAGQSRFSALRQFEVWACNNGGSSSFLHDDPPADCTQDSGYHKVYTSAADAFPADPPRPVAPHLILREFDISTTKATHLRLVVKTNQCTGGPAYQGEQDADPTATTDCDSNVAPSASFRFVRAAEFEAYTQDGSVDRH